MGSFLGSLIGALLVAFVQVFGNYYLPDFARFTEVNVVSTALIYEIIVAERLDMARVVVASSWGITSGDPIASFQSRTARCTVRAATGSLLRFAIGLLGLESARLGHRLRGFCDT